MRGRKKKDGSKIPEKKVAPKTSAPTPTGKEPEAVKLSDIKESLNHCTVLTDSEREAINKDLEMLCIRTREFLSSFIIIGYNLDGLPIQVIYGKQQKDLDALNLALSRFIFNNTTRGPQPGSPPASEPQDPHHDPH